MATGNVTIQGNQSGGPAGSLTFGPLTILAPAAIGSLQVIALSSGNNTITIPSLTQVAIITPPNAVSPAPNPAYAGTLTLKLGGSGDTGAAIANKTPTMLTWDATGSTSPATFVINASVSCTIEVWCM